MAERRISKLEVSLNGLVKSLCELITEWQPKDLESELKYRDALVAYLRAHFPEDCRVEREYRHAGTTTDVHVLWKGLLSKDEVFIEIKRNLQKKTSYDRLVGQIEALEPGKRKILVLLLGDTDPALADRLKSKYKDVGDWFDDSESVEVLVKT